MNDRRGKPPHPEKLSILPGTEPGSSAPAVALRPGVQPLDLVPSLITFPAKTAVKPTGRKNHSLLKDSFYIVKRGETSHVISEDYSYKTDSYYTILQQEMAGKKIQPSSAGVIDAFVVPICLERAKLAGIPVCGWEISQAYVPLPAIIYGINYFATKSEFVTVNNNEEAKEAVRHITNKGKYPFCYQELAEGDTISRCTAIFGKTTGQNDLVAHIAEKIYDLFAIPFVQMVLVHSKDAWALSSLSPARYTHLTENERSVLEAYISHQEFL
jgi:hypothetical protein